MFNSYIIRLLQNYLDMESLLLLACTSKANMISIMEIFAPSRTEDPITIFKDVMMEYRTCYRCNWYEKTITNGDCKRCLYCDECGCFKQPKDIEIVYLHDDDVSQRCIDCNFVCIICDRKFVRLNQITITYSGDTFCNSCYRFQYGEKDNEYESDFEPFDPPPEESSDSDFEPPMDRYAQDYSDSDDGTFIQLLCDVEEHMES